MSEPCRNPTRGSSARPHELAVSSVACRLPAWALTRYNDGQIRCQEPISGTLAEKKPFSVPSMSPPKSSPRGRFSPLHGIPCFRANLPRLESPAGVPGSPVTVRREHQRSSHVTGLVTVVFSFSLPVLPFRLELGLGASAFVRPIRVGTTFYPF